MRKWLRILIAALRSAFLTRRDLVLENLALRQQLAVYKEMHPRPHLTDADRQFWVLLSRIWRGWRATLHIVLPDTVVRWHRQGFRCYWRWKSRKRGQPAINPEVMQLIRRMCRANPLWGAPPSQAWKTFLENHLKETIALDFFTVPTATFKVLFVLVILSHDRRRILHFNVTEHPTAVWTARQMLQSCGLDDQPRYLIRDSDAKFGDAFQRQVRALGIEDVRTAPKSPWQNPYAERVIGSIRREFLDHVIVLSEAHLRRILSKYAGYYNGARTHLALCKDSPDERPVHTSKLGVVRELAHLGGLHHQYVRMAA